jgi:hypothetical protein
MDIHDQGMKGRQDIDMDIYDQGMKGRQNWHWYGHSWSGDEG